MCNQQDYYNIENHNYKIQAMIKISCMSVLLRNPQSLLISGGDSGKMSYPRSLLYSGNFAFAFPHYCKNRRRSTSFSSDFSLSHIFVTVGAGTPCPFAFMPSLSTIGYFWLILGTFGSQSIQH